MKWWWVSLHVLLDNLWGDVLHWWIENWTKPVRAVFITIDGENSVLDVVFIEEKFLGTSFLWFYRYPSVSVRGLNDFRSNHPTIPIADRVFSQEEMDRYVARLGLKFPWRKTDEKICFAKSGKNLRKFSF